ncbi:hypothetical protein RY27_06700, partial [Litorilinea aerophila]
MAEFARLSTRPPSEENRQRNSLSVDNALTVRELEVLALIATGASDRQIADQLFISLHTVKTHVRNILAKLHAANRHAAVDQARQRGLL